MKKIMLPLIALCLAALVACGSHDGGRKGGGFNFGTQSTLLTLGAGSNYDVDIPGGSPTAFVRVIPNASSGSTLNGLKASYFGDGDSFWIRNDGVSTLTIVSGDAGNLVVNDEFLTPNDVAIPLAPRQAVQVEWDKTATKFIISPDALAAATAGSETITAGSASLSVSTSYLSTTGTKAYTQGNGTFTGQRKCFEEITAATSPAGTLTITTPAGSESATHVFNAIGQRFCDEWNGVGWHTIEKHRAGHETFVVGTTLTAGHDMAATDDLSVTGTVVSTTTKALPNGSVPGEVVHLDVTTAASTASGTLGFAGTSVVGVAVTSAAGIGNGATDKTFVLVMLWDGASWQIIYLGTNTGVTIS